MIAPRFIRENALVPFDGGFLVDGRDQLLRLSGDGVEAIPRLIELMDGCHSTSELEHAAHGLTPDQVQKAIALLGRFGLIEDASNPIVRGPNLETLAFLRRFAGFTGANRNGSEVYARLQQSDVLILESSSIDNDVFQHLLIDSGLGRVASVSQRSLGSRHTSNALVVSLLSSEEVNVHEEEIWEQCRRLKLRWLRAVLNTEADFVDIGPLFIPNARPCYPCLKLVQGNPTDVVRTSCPTPPQALVALSAGLLAAEVVYLLSRVAPPLAQHGFRRYNTHTWASRDLPHFSLPGCDRCHPTVPADCGAVPSADTAPTAAWVFETSAVAENGNPLDANAMSERARIGAALSRSTKRLSLCAQVPLENDDCVPDCNVLDALASAHLAAGGECTLSQLGTILRMTAGIRRANAAIPEVKRWAATGGNLGSVELYLIARSVNGLRPGVYFYQPREHSLACLRWRDGTNDDVDALLNCLVPDGLERLPDGLVVFTGAFHRVVQKYGPFGYRLVHFDAGVALSQLRAVAHAFGLHTAAVYGWTDDVVETALNLTPFEELVTAVVGLYGSDVPRNNAPERRKAGRESVSAPHDFADLTLPDILNLVIRQSRTQPVTRGAQANIPRSEPRYLNREEGAAFCLAQPPTAGPSLACALERRASVRQFAVEPPDLEQLATMLHYAYGPDLLEPCETPDTRDDLEFRVLARRVNGLCPGVYIYRAETNSLVSCKAAPSSEDAATLLLQAEFANAPLQIWIGGRLRGSPHDNDSWRYRQLLLRAGAAVHRLSFAALGAGLCGSIVGGLVRSASRAVLGFDDSRHVALLAFVAGRALTSTDCL